VEIRPATAADAVAIIDVHFAAVHETAAAFYAREVLDRWSALPGEARYQRIRDAIAKGEELFLVAEEASGIVGFGSIMPSLQELHAVYVHPQAGQGLARGFSVNSSGWRRARGVATPNGCVCERGGVLPACGIRDRRTGRAPARWRDRDGLRQNEKTPDWRIDSRHGSSIGLNSLP
jgi:hypothetical protein